ncbi:MAG: hypothetical protein ACXVCY_11030 [Pseudobdellovibrionaceae bacterium]
MSEAKNISLIFQSPSLHPGNSLKVLSEIKNQLNTGQQFIEVKGLFKFTKTKKNYAEAILLKDKEFESDVSLWTQSKAR